MLADVATYYQLIVVLLLALNGHTKVTRVYQAAYDRGALPVRVTIDDGWYRSDDPEGLGDPAQIEQQMKALGFHNRSPSTAGRGRSNEGLERAARCSSLVTRYSRPPHPADRTVSAELGWAAAAWTRIGYNRSRPKLPRGGRRRECRSTNTAVRTAAPFSRPSSSPPPRT